ncbi:MAG: O-antigen ligase family protein [Bacteroidota bacterium]
MTFWRSNIGLGLIGLLYVAFSAYFITQDKAYFSLFSLGFLALFFAVYYVKESFLALAFLTPLSINIEEYTDSFGLFIPTEPLLFGMLLLILMQEIQKSYVPKHVWRHPIVICVGLYVVWLLMSTISSSEVMASVKFVIAKLWFFIPLLLLGPIILKDKKNIQRFLWLFLIGMTIVVSYTVLLHMTYSFGEKESHWVMWPFFKDHTIYGAIVALTLMLGLGVYFSKKHPPLTQALLLTMLLIIFIGLYFSYTRAAWLSVVGAFGVGLLIKLKIRFSYLLGTAVLLGGILFFTWDSIQMELARNKQDHTTEDFGERLQSATNVSTDASNLERLNRWTCAWEMFLERPVMGFGPGTYAFEYARFQHPENITIISTNFGDGGNAHSEYLGPLSETGAPGLLFFLAILFFVFYTGINLYNKWPVEDKETRTLIFFMILALSSYFIHGFLNNYLDTDKACVPIWGMAAIFIALDHKLKKEIF